MKRNTINYWIRIMIVGMVLWGNKMEAQPYPTFQTGGGTSNIINLDAKIRTYSSSSVMLYNKRIGRGYISKLDATANSFYCLRPTPFPTNGYRLQDMAVVDNMLFFCGVDTMGYKAILGWMDIPSGHLTVYTANVDSSILTDIVAYKNQMGNFKVVALGYSKYSPNGYPQVIETNCPTELQNFTWQQNYSAYRQQFVLEWEMTDPGADDFLCNIKAVGDKRFSEILHDIVLMDDDVVFLGVESVTPSLTVHKCNREHVLADFDIVYLYDHHIYRCCMNPIGCRMDDNTFGVALYAEHPPFPEHVELVYVIEISSMAMTKGQLFSTGDYKVFPLDMLYFRESKILTILQEYNFQNDPGNRHVFFNFEPYNPYTSYYARCYYDVDMSKPYVSFDKMPDDTTYISTCGNQWLLKKAPSVVNNNCCRLQTELILDFDIKPVVVKNHPFVECLIKFNTKRNSNPDNAEIVLGSCYVN